MNFSRKKIILTIILSVFVFVFIFAFASFDLGPLKSENVKIVKAQLPVTDIAGTGATVGQTIKDILREVKEAWRWVRDKVLVRTAKIAYKNALRNFLSQMAYRTAEWLATSGKDQGPLFTTESWKDFANNIVETTVVDTLDVLARDNGFFEFNICEPSDIGLKLNFTVSAFEEFTKLGAGKRTLHKPRCEFQELKKKWSDFGTSVAQNFQDSESFLNSLEGAFRTQQQDALIKVKFNQSLMAKIQDEKTKQFLSRLEKQGLEDITEPITGAIKTPAKFISGQAAALPANAPVAEETPTFDIVADAMGIFTNTLASKLLQRWLADASGGAARQASTQTFAWSAAGGAGGGQAAALQQQFGELAAVSFTVGQENVLEFLSSCPDPTNPGPTDCVMPPDMMTAVEDRLTVKGALEKNNLHGDWTVGWEEDVQPAYNSGYPYRSLVIMRTHRIIPVGWELAAWYAKKTGKKVTLNYLINCFEDADPTKAADPTYPESCREDINDTPSAPADDYNPYYHLVDPNWVLKAPESYCAKKGAGYKVIGEEWACSEDNVAGTLKLNGDNATEPYCEEGAYNHDIPVKITSRDAEYCADWQSCLLEDDEGNCTGVRGYCLKEKELWRFNGESCSAQYNSCETLTRQSDEEQFNFLTNTLTQCLDTNDAGCRWYALEQERLVTTTSWQVGLNDPKVYLNSQAETCEISDVGCTKLGRVVPGVNLALNGNYQLEDTTVYSVPNNPADLPLNWSLNPIQAQCTYEHLEDEGTMQITANSWGVGTDTHCNLYSEGFIPINQEFTYQLSYKIKAQGSGLKAAITLVTYDENKEICATTNLNSNPACRQTNGDEVFDGVMTIGTEYTGYAYQIGPASNINNDFLPGVSYVKVAIKGPHQQSGATGLNNNLSIDEVQFGIVKSPIVQDNPPNFQYATTTYTADYSRATSLAHSQHLKVAPAYLSCDKYNEILLQYTTESACYNADPAYFWRNDIGYCVAGGSELCGNYATYCQAQEIGCQGYLPVNGDPEVPAITAPEDVCPTACENYDSYVELANFFEQVECPNYSQTECNNLPGCQWAAGSCQAQPGQQLFIPETAQSCSIAEVGCEEFTNLDEVAQGGEGKEYFTYLRQCISPDNPEIGTYYTWEGSDTTGYQLKKWEFLKSNLPAYQFIAMGNIPPQVIETGTAPCTNIAIGTENCVDDSSSFVYNPNLANPYATADPQVPKVCTQTDIEQGEYNCRDFFDASGNHFFRLQDQAATASSNCHPYRRTATGQIYNADPTEGISCSAAVNGCREYKGNSGNNVRVVLTDEFESGTTGNWVNDANQSSSGIQISNESITQSGHSLRVFISNDKVSYPVTGQVTAGKQYQLSFWGKKAMDSSCPAVATKALVNTYGISGEEVWLTYTASLTNFWADYNLGPIQLSAIGSPTLLTIEITDLDDCEAIYIDNVVFKEFTDNFYVVRDSWQTPVACDNNLDNPIGIATCTGSPNTTCQGSENGIPFSCFIPPGATSCQVGGLRLNYGAQQGCLEYQDRENATHYLKSFDNLCSDAAIGCEAYITTQNSTNYQSEHVYKTSECNDIVGLIETNGDCVIRGQVMCNVGSGNSCDYQSPAVPNDEIVYLVNDEEKSCAGAQQGCSQLGLPELDLQLGDLANENYVTSTEAVLIVNNPDDYLSTLCSPSGEFCTQYSVGSQSQFYYYDPTSLTGNEATNKTCFYDETLNKWLTSGNNEECNGQLYDLVTNARYLPRNVDENYEGWAGLCESSQASCRTYLDAEKAEMASVEKCDAKIDKQYSGVCDGNASGVTIGNREYCRATVNGLEHNVCDITSGTSDNCENLGGNQWRYPANAWVCNLGGTVNANTDCCIGGQTFACGDEPNEEIKACTVYSGNQYCYYNMFCEGYSYLQNSVSTGNCNGLVDREKGCILFKDSAMATTSLEWASRSTLDNQAPQTCDPAKSVLFDDSCNANALLEVRKDRECAEWLHCGSTITDPAGQNLCIDLIRCGGVDGSGQTCTKIIPEPPAPAELTIDLTDLTTRAANVNSVRYLSGYSKVGAVWKSGSNPISVAGYFSPEQMEQIGEKVVVNYGDMEVVATTTYGYFFPIGWEIAESGGASANYCTYGIDYNNAYSGQYSLKSVMTEGAAAWKEANPTSNFYCGARNDNNGDYYGIEPAKKYSLSWWSKSQNGAQGNEVGFRWYGADGTLCDLAHNYCNTASPAAPVSGQWGSSSVLYYTAPDNWTRYTITFGPVGDTEVDFEIPPLAGKVAILMAGPNTYNNGQPGFILLDDVTIEPVLKVDSSADPTLVAKDCRLFSKDDSPACAYLDIKQYQGWNGYCLEPDPKVSYNPNPENPLNRQTCLQWYPIDSLAGDSLVFNVENIGYQGPENLYYCAQSKGNYNRDLDGTHTISWPYFEDNSTNCSLSNNNAIYGTNFQYYRPIKTALHGTVDDDQTCEYCGNVENVGMCRDGTAHGVCGCTENTSIGNNANGDYNAYNADAEDQYEESELERIVWVVSRPNNSDWVPPYDNGIGYVYFELSEDDLPNSPFNNVPAGAWRDGWTAGSNHFQAAITFNTDNKVDKYWAFMADWSDNDGGAWITGLAVLREPCTTIVRAVEQGSEKVWLSKYNDGWPTTTPTGQPDNILGYSKFLPSNTPYTGLYGSIYNTNAAGPNAWGDEPYLVNLSDFSQNAGLPYSTANLMDSVETGSGRVCIAGVDTGGGGSENMVGSSCNNNADCKTGGICSGLGKYCFNNQGITTGQRCDDNTDCGSGQCLAIGHDSANPNSTVQLYEPELVNAIDRVQKLFARIYGVWEWDNATEHYVETTANYDPDDLDRTDTYGQAPEIYSITVKGQTTGDVQVTAPGEQVSLAFNSDVNGNQLPIESMYIDWHDGNQTSIAGPLSDKPAGSAHYLTHTYTCQPDINNSRCVSCLPGGEYNAANGTCKYRGPSINLKDHWDWCANGSLLNFGTSCDADNGVSYGSFTPPNNYNVGAVSPYYIIVGP